MFGMWSIIPLLYLLSLRYFTGFLRLPWRWAGGGLLGLSAWVLIFFWSRYHQRSGRRRPRQGSAGDNSW